MAFRAGKDSWFALDNVATTLTVLSPYIDSIDWPQSVEQLDVSTIGTTPKAFIPGLTDGDTVSISGPYDVAVYTHLTALKAAHSAGSTTSTVMYGPGGSIASQAKISAECYVMSFQPPSGVGGRVEWSATLQITGAVTNGTF